MVVIVGLVAVFAVDRMINAIQTKYFIFHPNCQNCHRMINSSVLSSFYLCRLLLLICIKKEKCVVTWCCYWYAILFWETKANWILLYSFCPPLLVCTLSSDLRARDREWEWHVYWFWFSVLVVLGVSKMKREPLAAKTVTEQRVRVKWTMKSVRMEKGINEHGIKEGEVEMTIIP